MGYSGNMYAQATEVITSQGDLRRGDSSGNPERLAIGSSGKVLQSNGTTESWQTLTTADSVLTTQGDILVEGASGLERLGQSTDGFLLTTKGAGANPVWAAASGGATVARVDVELSAEFSTTSTSYVDVTGFTLTKPTISGGVCLAIASFVTFNSNTGTCTDFALNDNGSDVSFITNQEGSGGYMSNGVSMNDTSVADGYTLKVTMKVSAGTGYCQYYRNGCDSVPKMSLIGVG